MILDIRTLAFVSSTTSLVLFFWLAYVDRTRKTYPGFRQWTMSAFLFFCGMVLISLRNIWPDMLTVVVGNSAFIGAFILADYGLRRFHGRRPAINGYIINLAILSLSFTYFTFIRPDVAIRIVIVSVLVSIYCFRIGYDLWKYRTPTSSFGRGLLIGTFMLLGFWDLARPVLTMLLEAHVADFMHAGAIQSVTLIVFIGGSILMYAGLATLNAERIEADLTRAMENIRTLQGFLPICANCKRIRDDRGYWKHVEEYIEHHTEAVMTHGICPDCEKKLYPEIDPESGQT
jgi:hypothetical protein